MLRVVDYVTLMREHCHNATCKCLTWFLNVSDLCLTMFLMVSVQFIETILFYLDLVHIFIYRYILNGFGLSCGLLGSTGTGWKKCAEAA